MPMAGLREPAQARSSGLLENNALPVDPIYLDNPITGFRAHVYHNEAAKEVVIAFAGTNLAERGDLSAIGEIIAGHVTKTV